MPSSDSCCTCAILLTDTKIPYDTTSEKPICLDRRLDCCGRTICASCQHDNPRFQTYCPFCQISTEPSALPAAGLRLPPTYSETSGPLTAVNDEPPPYTERSAGAISLEASSSVPKSRRTDAVVHHLSTDDTVHSLSLAYGVPQHILRAYNSLHSDSLLAARKFILVPRSHYDGPPLSEPPDPVEEDKKKKLRRWMVATKCPDYDIAVLYLKASDYKLDLAIEAFKSDEQWEKVHPMKGKDKPASKKTVRTGLTGRLP